MFQALGCGEIPPGPDGPGSGGGKESERPSWANEAYDLLKSGGQFEGGDYAPKNDEYPLDGYPGIIAIEFPSVEYKGKGTNVFGYLGIPAGASAENRVPGVVLVHGALGTAYPQWVKLWRDAGYAALAIDVEGRRPDGSVSGLGGPQNDGMFTGSLPIQEQWMFHALSAVIKAHTVLSGLPYVDPGRTGVTGISWGGIIAGSVIGIDNRFRFAVPVYGSGYMVEGKSLHNGEMFKEHQNAYRLWDPSNWFPGVAERTEVMFLNSDVDGSFSLNITSRSSEAVSGSRMSVHNKLPHGHIEGWSRPEIVAFADESIGGEARLAKITEQPDASSGREVRLGYTVPAGVQHSVEVYTMAGDYSFSPGMPYLPDRDFEKSTVQPKDSDGVVTFELPEDIDHYYVNIRTRSGGRDYVVSTRLISLNGPGTISL